ncbi:DUF2752 domain-containing protein [Serinibacter arcticus]|uniref:DUF2752 domain-containing protein n=1 Tax=Serinibacter arcticus TaxID=1655435 RepID=A0A2U1ZZ59_9MICO|nr:DUF2752 domain-containing protein [Serinibacter arcticus]
MAATTSPAAATGASWRLPATVAATIAAAVTVLVVRTPHSSGSYGVCPSVLLGLACPGCGGLRGTYELVHGDVASAWAFNPLVVVGAPLVLALLIRWGWDAAAGRAPWTPPSWLAWLSGAAVVVFWVLRNVPALSPYLGPLAVP